MNILHLSTNDFGGAGSAATRIHRAHMGCGHNSILLVKNTRSNQKGVIAPNNKQSLWNKIKRIPKVILRRILFKNKYLMYSVFDSGHNNVLKDIKAIHFIPDIIALHWVAGYVGLSDVINLQKKYGSKIIWYAMDMAPITGGCHFSFSCTNYKMSCSNCPAERSLLKLGITTRFLKKKKQVIQELAINIMAPNNWVAHQVTNSNVYPRTPAIAFIPIDESLFSPSYSFYAPKEFSIMFGSQNLDDNRKGGKYFMRALELLDKIICDSNIHLQRAPVVIIPGLDKSKLTSKLSIDIVSFSFATNEKQLASLYNKTDLYVCCSIEDSGPMMVSEALMSGVPVLGFNTGICPEVIQNNYNGAVVPMRNSQALAESMFEFLCMTDKEYMNLKIQARESALKFASNSSHCKQFFAKDILEK